MAILENFGEVWQRTSLVQRVLLLGVLLLCLGATAMLVVWARQPQYSLLYSGLSPDEAARIVEKIRDNDIPHELKDGGTSVYVASDKVYELRLTMAGEGLPQGHHAGYRILENEKIGTSPFMQKVNHVRAIEGELAKTIETLDAVSAARVHVVPAESTLFGGQERHATATAVLRLKGGRRLATQNVTAIVNMLAGGVEGLTPDNVTVVDSEGNLLSIEGDNRLAKSARGVLDHKVQAEEYLAHKVEGMLEEVLGPNRAAVKVAVTVDTTSLEEIVETPTQGVATREKETTKNTTPVAGGKGASGSSTKEKTTETETATGRTVRKTTSLPGKVTVVSVSCFVDLTPPKAKDAEEGEKAPSTPLMADTDVQEMIVSALGLTDPTMVKVVPTRFHQAEVPAAAETDEGMFTKDFILEMARRGSLGILVICALLALKIIRKKPTGIVPASGGGVAIEEQVPQADNLLTAGAAGGQSRDALRSQITRALQDNPDEVKRLFLSWASSDQGGA